LQARKALARRGRRRGMGLQRRMDNGAAMVKLDKGEVKLERPGDNLAQQGGGADGQGKMER